MSEIKEEIHRCRDEIGKVSSSISELDEKGHLSERYGIFDRQCCGAERIVAPTLNAILPPMCTNYSEQSRLESLREKENLLREKENHLREKENHLIQLQVLREQWRLQREQDTSS